MNCHPSIVFVLLVAGCGSIPERSLSDAPATYAMLPNGHDPMNPDQLSPIYAAAANGSNENLARDLERLKGRPLNILSISGGGQNGAFGAGFLNGWRESGQRPAFDAVTGVSTGALLATHALLGTPEDDAKLEAMYTQITQQDIYESKSIFSILSGTDSLLDTTPLQHLIAKYITEETLKRVAAALEDQRFLFVGTTNIDYDQTWVWNLSLVAQDGNLELYRNVLLASASFPIMFPPVEIEGHLFVRGGSLEPRHPGALRKNPPGPPLHGAGNIFLIDNGKLTNPPAALRRALGEVAATTIGVMMNQSMQTAMLRTYFGCRALGYNFKYVGIESHVAIGKDPLAFDPDQMRAAFDAGRTLGKQSDPWNTEAPASNDLPTWAAQLISPPQ